MQKEGFYFTDEEIDALVAKAKTIGFEPNPILSKDKVFDKSKVLGHITFTHLRSGNTLSMERYEIRALKLDIFKDTISDIFFGLLYNQIEEMEYSHNYEG